MKLLKLVFSPTGGTMKAAELLAGGLPGEPETIDLCRRDAGPAVCCGPEDLVLIAVPSFGGRAPGMAVRRIGEIKGNGAKAVLLCVYGNRAYEDTLAELEGAASAAGFNVIAGCAAVAGHSIARSIAAGRPDSADAEKLSAFAGEIARKLAAGDDTAPQLPGRRPEQPAAGGGMVPLPGEGCTRCGVCARECPAGAIDPADPGKTDGEACISCMRCTAVCPAGVRALPAAQLEGVTAYLASVCAERKEPELYL